MARIYLDEIGGLNQGILNSYGVLMSPFSTEDYAPTVAEVQTAPVRTRRKQSKPKAKKKNDGVIRNHDSIFDYKIQDGKLLTRRKTSDGNWIDITNNDEARQRVEQFTGRTVSGTKTSNVDSSSNPKSSRQVNNQTDIVVDNQTRSRNKSVLTISSLEQPAQLENRGLGYIARQLIPQDIQPIQQFNINDVINNSPKDVKLTSADLKNRNWHWGGVDDISFEGVSNALYADAVKRAQEQGKVLLDSKGRPVTNRDVNLYLNYTPPDRISTYDAQFYQPQSENSTLKDVRKAQDFRRNREFDRQRNAALAVMAGLPLAGIGAAEALMVGGPLALAAGYLGSDIGGKLTNAVTQKYYGKTWDEISNDPNINFYAQLLNPGRWIGGALGGYGGARMWNRMTPIGQYPSGEYEFVGDKIGKLVPRQSKTYNQRTAAMTYDPTGEVPVVSQVTPGYSVELPPKTIKVSSSEEPMWYDTRFENTMRNMQAKGMLAKPKKRSVKTTKGTKRKTSKKTKKQIVDEAYNQAYSQ